MKTLYQIREIKLVYDTEQKIYSIFFGTEKEKVFTEPLEAWVYFIERADSYVRRRIKNMQKDVY